MPPESFPLALVSFGVDAASSLEISGCSAVVKSVTEVALIDGAKLDSLDGGFVLDSMADGFILGIFVSCGASTGASTGTSDTIVCTGFFEEQGCAVLFEAVVGAGTGEDKLSWCGGGRSFSALISRFLLLDGAVLNLAADFLSSPTKLWRAASGCEDTSSVSKIMEMTITVKDIIIDFMSIA